MIKDIYTRSSSKNQEKWIFSLNIALATDMCTCKVIPSARLGYEW